MCVDRCRLVLHGVAPWVLHLGCCTVFAHVDVCRSMLMCVGVCRRVLTCVDTCSMVLHLVCCTVLHVSTWVNSCCTLLHISVHLVSYKRSCTAATGCHLAGRSMVLHLVCCTVLARVDMCQRVSTHAALCCTSQYTWFPIKGAAQQLLVVIWPGTPWCYTLCVALCWHVSICVNVCRLMLHCVAHLSTPGFL